MSSRASIQLLSTNPLFKAKKQKRVPFSAPYHVDNGMFLLLTPNAEQPLLVQDRHGNQLVADAGDVVVVFGRGLSQWLFQTSPKTRLVMIGAESRRLTSTLLEQPPQVELQGRPTRRPGHHERPSRLCQDDCSSCQCPATVQG